jgi:hypothetical protein
VSATCDTFGCENAATHRASWPSKTHLGTRVRGVYCDDCASLCRGNNGQVAPLVSDAPLTQADAQETHRASWLDGWEAARCEVPNVRQEAEEAWRMAFGDADKWLGGAEAIHLFHRERNARAAAEACLVEVERERDAAIVEREDRVARHAIEIASHQRQAASELIEVRGE